jgi:O-antigen/teichoic acid export membrane protein
MGYSASLLTIAVSELTEATASRGALSNAGWNAFGTFSSIVISFVLAPILIRNMGTDEYGILLLVWSVTGILGLVNFGFGEATLRYIAHYFGQQDLTGVNRVIGATLSFYLLVCSFAALVLFVGAPVLANVFSVPESAHDVVALLLRLAAVCFALRAVSLCYGAVPMALHRYDISNKIGIIQNVVRSAGYILLAVSGFGIVHIILWDIATLFATLAVLVVVIHRLAPGVSLVPSLSLSGLREIIGFSVFSFLTYAFHMLHRESGKLIVGSQLGVSPVAYLGTPDNVAQRLHMVVASGGETLMPRFSANQDPQVARSLFLHGTWASLVVSLVLLLPLVLLMPAFLSLWISPEFSRESAVLGQLVALSYVTQGAYAPAATYFRGIGKPWLVTIVIAFAGMGTVLLSLFLVPRVGLLGVGYALVLGSIPPLLGVIHAWFSILGRSQLGGLFRLVALPLLMSAVSFAVCRAIRGQVAEVGWFWLFMLGGIFVAITGLLVVGADLALGGNDASSRRMLRQIGQSRKLVFIYRTLRPRRAH